MRRDCRDDPDVATFCRCFNAATGEEIAGVVWADDEAGEYGTYQTDENGKTVLVDGELVCVTHKAAIRLVDERMNGTPL